MGLPFKGDTGDLASVAFASHFHAVICLLPKHHIYCFISSLKQLGLELTSKVLRTYNFFSFYKWIGSGICCTIKSYLA